VFFEGPPDSMRDPAILARMDRLQQQILALPNVGKAVSLVDYVKRVNRELNDGRKDAPSLRQTVSLRFSPGSAAAARRLPPPATR